MAGDDIWMVHVLQRGIKDPATFYVSEEVAIQDQIQAQVKRISFTASSGSVFIDVPSVVAINLSPTHTR